ncbi:GNAT family N-acetyltransferase [Terricaulis sp.]|uniref:GNAT family N-acetyltransferase n=1 Tax=Terricaulis sp. TaxID=2768686 RepID=UPI003783A70D
MRIETIHPKEIGPGEAALWRAHQAADASLASPYFTPEWARLIGQVRDDARVCVIGGGRGFFAAQRVNRFAAMGIGAPLSDYQGVVGEQGLSVNAAALCKALRVGRIDLVHVPQGQSVLANAAAGAEGSWVAETHGGGDLYAAGLKLKRQEFVRQTDKKLRKFEREHGQLTFSVSADRAHFETLLTWKNAQLRRSGQPEIWARPWVRRVLDDCFLAREHGFAGVLFTLSLGERLVAANFMLRSHAVLHDWVVAHDNAFDSYSPGVLLARWAIGWAGDHGVAEVEFGLGDTQYKRQLSTTQRMLEWGVVAGPSVSGALRRATYALRAGVERMPDKRLAALPGKAMRRLDLMRALAA